MQKPKKKCFICGMPCFGYKCKDCIKKGRWGSLTRRAVNRRSAYRRKNYAIN